MQSAFMLTGMLAACATGWACGCNPFTNAEKDQDGDGFEAVRFDGDDCNDLDSAINPSAQEICNGIDDDCSGEADDGPDEDGDGFAACDCDDADPWINPDRPEICGLLDDDCSGEADDGPDPDRDGYAACDCDQQDATVHPGAAEICNARDDDCDGQTDEGQDADGDGVAVCDCDDADPGAFPGATEGCNRIDDDCDGQTDEGLEVAPCALQAGVCAGSLTGCQDGQWLVCDYGPAFEPGAETSCDGLDNDCDGLTDEDLLQLVPEQGAEAHDGIDNNCNGLIDEPGGVMVPIPGLAGTWVDAFEMTVFDDADCSGTRYGEADDDYPAGWPVEGEAQVILYACSLPGLIPSGHLSFYRARRACAAQHKRLCTDFEYRPACDGNSFNLFPYANVFVPGVCNDPIGGIHQPAETGSHDLCTADRTTFDMSGNLAEWVDREAVEYPGYYPVAGYGYDCELCFLENNCWLCNPDDPSDQDRALIEAVSQCPVFDFMGAGYYEYRAFRPQTARAFMGGRCCYP